MCRRQRLDKWVQTLEKDMMRDLLVELVDFAIDSEYVNFYEDTKVPYWDGNGENLDGTVIIDEDEECPTCPQTIENCECHISNEEKHSGLYKMVKALPSLLKEMKKKS